MIHRVAQIRDLMLGVKFTGQSATVRYFPFAFRLFCRFECRD
jgi:hypothetical protein